MGKKKRSQLPTSEFTNSNSTLPLPKKNKKTTIFNSIAVATEIPISTEISMISIMSAKICALN